MDNGIPATGSPANDEYISCLFKLQSPVGEFDHEIPTSQGDIMIRVIVVLFLVSDLPRYLVIEASNQTNCTIRSYFLNADTNTAGQSLLRVEVNSTGVPSGVSVTGQDHQVNVTEFVTITFVTQRRLGATIHWGRNQNYTLAVKSRKIVLEAVGGSNFTDSHTFLIRSAPKGCTPKGCVTIQSILDNSFITTNHQGQVLLGNSRIDRAAWFIVVSKS